MRNRERAALEHAPESQAEFRTRVRLYVLLTLLVPLFAGLQYLVREAVPRVEIRLVSQDVPASVPVMVPIEVPVERVVERIVYVPVERGEATAPLEAPANVPGPQEAVAQTSSDTIAAADADIAPPNEDAQSVAAAGEAPAPMAQAISAPPAPQPAIIATGTYRPQREVAAAQAAAPRAVPDAAEAEPDEAEPEADKVADAPPLDEVVAEDATADDADETVMVALTVVDVSSSGDGATSISVQMVPVTRPRADGDPTTEPAPEAQVPANDDAGAAALADDEAEADEVAEITEAAEAEDEQATMPSGGDETAEINEHAEAEEPSEVAVEQAASELAVTSEGVTVEERAGQ